MSSPEDLMSCVSPGPKCHFRLSALLCEIHSPASRSIRYELPCRGSPNYQPKMEQNLCFRPISQLAAKPSTTLFIVPESRLPDIFGTLLNGTLITHPKNGQYVLPCNLMSPYEEVLKLTLGGVEFGMQFRDLM